MVSLAMRNTRKMPSVRPPPRQGGFPPSDSEESQEPEQQHQGPADFPHHYEELEAPKNADEAEIKLCYRSVVQMWHPDKHPTKRREAEERIRRINRAFDTLGSPVKRATYDIQVAAVERKRKGERLENNVIKERAIPTEFYLCPLGHDERFVRADGVGLKVHNRADTPGLEFKDFFRTAKFSLWWLPEGHNVCRLRSQESMAQSLDGGLFVNFMLQRSQAGVPEADVVLSHTQDPRYTNLTAVPSPYTPGGIRFEATLWPGHFISFREPTTLRMDSVGEATDFLLVDCAISYVSMEEVLVPAVDHQCVGGEHLKLSDLRADLSIRTFFQNAFRCAVWNNKDFDAYFSGHFELWDYDRKHARVRLRPKEQQLTKRLQLARRQAAVVETVLSAGDELCLLELDVASMVLARLSKAPREGLAADKRLDLLVARGRLLSAVPLLPGAGSTLHSVLAAYRSVTAAGQGLNGEDPDTELSDARDEAAKSLARRATVIIQNKPSTLQFDILLSILALPLNWADAATPLCTAMAPILAEPRAPGSFLPALRCAAVLGPSATPFVEIVARREFSLIEAGLVDVAAEVMLTVVEAGVMLEETVALLCSPLLQRLPLASVVSLVGALGERDCENEKLQPLVQAITDVPLDEVPAPALLRLAVAATKSEAIAEKGLGHVAAAASVMLHVWALDDVTKLLLVVAKSKQCASSGAATLFARATEVIGAKLPELSEQQLIKIVFAITSVEQCRQLLEAAADQAMYRLSDLKPAQLLLLTQGLLPLGASHRVVALIIDYWAELLSLTKEGEKEDASVAKLRAELDEKSALPPDQLSRLASLLAEADPSHAVFESLCTRLMRSLSGLTDEARTSLEATFPEGAGPEFPSKAAFLAALKKPQSTSRERRRRSAGARQERSRSRSRRRVASTARRSSSKSVRQSRDTTTAAAPRRAGTDTSVTAAVKRSRSWERRQARDRSRSRSSNSRKRRDRQKQVVRRSRSSSSRRCEKQKERSRRGKHFEKDVGKTKVGKNGKEDRGRGRAESGGRKEPKHVKHEKDKSDKSKAQKYDRKRERRRSARSSTSESSQDSGSRSSESVKESKARKSEKHAKSREKRGKRTRE